MWKKLLSQRNMKIALKMKRKTGSARTERERERESKGERECRRSRPSQWEGKRFSRIAASSAGCGRMEPKTGEHLLGEVIKRMQQFL